MKTLMQRFTQWHNGTHKRSGTLWERKFKNVIVEDGREAEQDESVIDRIVAAQREELEQEITGLKAEAERVANEARELAGVVPF